jgi:hypothetical protein
MSGNAYGGRGPTSLQPAIDAVGLLELAGHRSPTLLSPLPGGLAHCCSGSDRSRPVSVLPTVEGDKESIETPGI